MSHRFENDSLEDAGPDPQVAGALALLDPAFDDPMYWARFTDVVIGSATPELARRRMAARVTVGDVLFSWARTVVPTALVAAAFAGLVLLKAEAVPAPEAMGVEELLVSELEGMTIPSVLSPDSPVTSASFLSEIF